MPDEFKILPDPIQPNYIPIGLDPLSAQTGFEIDDVPDYNEKPIDPHLPINWEDIAGLKKPDDNASSSAVGDTVQSFVLGANLTAGDPVRVKTADNKIYHVYESNPAVYDTNFLESYTSSDSKVFSKVIKIYDNKHVYINVTRPTVNSVKISARVLTFNGLSIILKTEASTTITITSH